MKKANTPLRFDPKPDIKDSDVKNLPITTNVSPDVYRDFMKLLEKKRCTKSHYLRELIIFKVKEAKFLGEI